MAIILQVPSNTYSASTRSFAFTAGSAAQNYRLTLTTPSWPTVTLSIDIRFGGVPAVAMSSTYVAPLLARDGSPMAQIMIECSKPAGVTAGEATITNSVALTTAITVESR